MSGFTPEEIAAMAKESELVPLMGDWKASDFYSRLTSYTTLVADKAAARAMEACAQVCEMRMTYWHRDDGRVSEDECCAAAIRALLPSTLESE